MAGPIADAAKAAALLARKTAFNGSMDALAKNLYDGRITLGMWEEDMRTRLRLYLTGSAAIGKGDWDAMTSSDWGKVGAQLKKQYRWVHGFSQAIYDNRDTISLKAIQARAHLYGDAGNTLANEAQAGYFAPNVRRTPNIILPYIPGDESAPCWHRCGCIWDMEVLGEDPDQGIKTVQATWVVNPAKESCEVCLSRDGHVEVVEVPIGVEVPPFIGLGGV